MNATEERQERGSGPGFLVSVSDRHIHLLVGLFMGLAVYGLVEHADWLAERVQIAYPLWLLALFSPTLFMLCYTRESRLRALGWVGAISVVLALLALYTGWQAASLDRFPYPFAQSMLVACFIVLIHLQPVIWARSRDYGTFFTLSWRNFLTVALSVALALCVWLTLYL